MSLVPWRLDLWGKSSWIWMIFKLKIKLNRSWNFLRKNVPLVLLERSWWAWFNGIYLVRFGFKMWEILILKWFLSVKITFFGVNLIAWLACQFYWNFMFLFYLLLLPVWLVQLGFRYGMILFIVSEVMSFLTFFWVPSSLGNLPLEGLQFKHDFLSYLAIQNIVHMLSFPIL